MSLHVPIMYPIAFRTQKAVFLNAFVLPLVATILAVKRIQKQSLQTQVHQKLFGMLLRGMYKEECIGFPWSNHGQKKEKDNINFTLQHKKNILWHILHKYSILLDSITTL